MKVGFIGLGIMGKPMCKNLIKAGYEMVVTTHNKETLKEMEAFGAKTVTCGREVAEEANVIITMLPNSPQVREVALGKDGIIEGAKDGSVLIDMSSIDPTESRAIAAELAKNGIEMLDAPVSGGEPKAIDGTISVMAGGKKEIFDKYYDLMMTMAGSAVYVGPIGSGNVAKTGKSDHRSCQYCGGIRSTDTCQKSRNRSGACVSGNPWRSCGFHGSGCKGTDDDGSKFQTGISH